MAPTMSRLSSTLRVVILFLLASLCASFWPSNPIRSNSAKIAQSPLVKSTTSVQFERRQYVDPSSLRPTVLNSELGESSGPIDKTDDNGFDLKTTVAIVGGQSLLIGGAAIAALVVGTPNLGLGPGFSFTSDAIGLGILYTLPLGVVSFLLDQVEDRFPALQDVTKATDRSVLALLGGTFRPVIATVTAVALGLAAGIGEEMLFRGILQYELCWMQQLPQRC